MKLFNNIEKEKKDLMKYRLKGIEPLLVVAGLIEKDGKYLIAQRKRGDDLVFGKWEFPGGKVKEGEEEKTAIEREMREEFKLNIEADKYVCNVIYEYPTRTINLKLWHGNVLDKVFDMDESDHLAYKWVSLDEINDLELCPADKELYQKIKLKN